MRIPHTIDMAEAVQIIARGRVMGGGGRVRKLYRVEMQGIARAACNGAGIDWGASHGMADSDEEKGQPD